MKKYGSVLEIFLVIAIAIFVMVFTIRYFTIADLNTRVAQAITKIDIISRASHSWRLEKQKWDFSDISIQALIDDKILNENDGVNPWGGKITLMASTQNPQRVTIQLTAVPPNACERLRQHLKTIAFTQSSSADCQRGYYYGEF